jgi:CPA2 family monovalent cation:H+ antiporter-2
MQLLIEQKQAAQPVGRAALAVLLFQDILVAPILIFVGFVNIEAGANLTAVLLEALLNGLIAIIVIMIIGRFGLRRMFRLAAAAGGRDFLMALTLLTVVGAAAITATAGLSLALGAFLAGLLLGETEFKHQTEVDLEPFKGILLGLFFMTVGMGLDLPSILSQPWTILAGLGVLLALKLVIGFGALRLFAGPTPMSIEAAFLLAPAGEFAFVVIAAATAAGALAPEPAGMMAAIAGLSMFKAFHKLRPEVPIIARARDHEHAQRLIDAGAKEVIPDAVESGLQMAGRTLLEFGYNDETIRDRLAAERDEEYHRIAT